MSIKPEGILTILLNSPKLLVNVIFSETLEATGDSKREEILVSAESVQDLRKTFGNNVWLTY